jgi:two-component system response regulator YesN
LVKSIVIVEDEKLVLLGIESLFEQNSQYKIVGSFSRADQALRAIDQLNPDIILTDIKMPGMDGLEFIKRLQEGENRAQVVVLSCLEDFAIVSTAFKLGAVDYILKHELDAFELFKTLDGLSLEREGLEEKQPKISSKPDWAQLHRFSDRLKNDARLALHTTNPIVYRMIFKKKYSEEHLPLKLGVDIFWCLRFVHRLLDDFQVGQVYHEESEGLVLVLDGSKDNQDQRKQFFRQLTRQLKQYINSPVIILRGSEVASLSIEEQWNQLLDVERHIFYVDSTRVEVISDPPKQSVEAELPPPIWLLQPEQLPLWHKGMEKYFEAVRVAQIDPSNLCMSLIVYWHQIEQLLHSLFGSLAVTHSPLFNYLKEFDDFNQLVTWYSAELPRRTAHIHDLQGHSRKIVQMKLYLHEHYAEHITLQFMAERLNLNSNYLSELFKKESGVGFIEYLNTIRINKAKSLLLESDATVETISSQVGFVSASHFSRIFKKMVGQTISEFRATSPCSQEIEQEN